MEESSRPGARRLPIPPGLWSALLFVLAGLPFLRSAGLHVDASYELAGFYGCSNPAWKITIFRREVPVMIIQYLGAFKAWLYQPLLRHFEVSPFAVRLPTLLVGACSVWMFYLLLNRVSGRRALPSLSDRSGRGAILGPAQPARLVGAWGGAVPAVGAERATAQPISRSLGDPRYHRHLD